MIHFDLKRHNQLLSIEKLNKLNKNKMNKFNIGDEVICIHSNFYIDYVKNK